MVGGGLKTIEGKEKETNLKIIKRNQTVKGKCYFGMPTHFT